MSTEKQTQGRTMAGQHDTLARIIKMLQMIPTFPGRVATTTLKEKLEDQGFSVTARTIQRDLKSMETFFPLLCEDTEKPHRWSFDKDYSQTLPGMDANKALTLVLANEYLYNLLPRAVVDSLSPQVAEARKFLDGLESNHLSRWRHQVRAISQGKALLPAQVDPDVWRAVTNGLLHSQALHVQYQKRHQSEPIQYLLHPQGLVHRDSVTYLLATAKYYDDILQFALHRFVSVEPSEEPYRPQPEFNVDAYIREGGFGYKESEQPIELRAWVSPELFVRLTETPLTDNQSLTKPDDSGWGYLAATVNDEQAMQWWLQSLGATIRVEAPQHWRDILEDQAKQLVGWYGKSV